MSNYCWNEELYQNIELYKVIQSSLNYDNQFTIKNNIAIFLKAGSTRRWRMEASFPRLGVCSSQPKTRDLAGTVYVLTIRLLETIQ